MLLCTLAAVLHRALIVAASVAGVAVVRIRGSRVEVAHWFAERARARSRRDLAVDYDFDTLEGAAERAQPGVGAKRALVVSVVGFGVRLVPALLALRACLLEV